jgi:hypothetical protein
VRRLAPLLAATAGLLCVAGPAAAADYCVSPEASCAASDTFADVQPALSSAQANSGADRVLIGAGDFTVPRGGLSYDSSDPVEVLGAGATVTVLHQPNPTPAYESALRIADTAAGSSVVADLGVEAAERDMTVFGTQTNVGLNLGRNVSATRVRVRAAPGAEHLEGVVARGGATIAQADIDVGFGSGGSVALEVRGGGAANVETSEVRGWAGVEVTADATAHIRRVSAITEYNCVSAFAGRILAEEVVCRLKPLPYAPSYAFFAGPGGPIGTIVDSRTDDPRFVSGELRLRGDSPLIDIGDPFPSPGRTEDLDGNERIRDGNGDGVARLDLGAFEYQGKKVE